MPPQNIPFHNVPPPQVQAQIQYHPQHIQYQNGHIPAQIHYTMQPPHQQFEQKPDSPEQQKSHGVKRRFSDVEGGQVKYRLPQIYQIEIRDYINDNCYIYIMNSLEYMLQELSPSYQCVPLPAQRHGTG